ncbi:sulfatase [Verrucomicrobiota bacterium]
MNLIFIVTDTWRADFLGCYGNDWIKTPHMDKLAEQSVQFNTCHGEGLPTIQARRVFMTGREILPFEDAPLLKGVSPVLPGWMPIDPAHETIADHLSKKGYTCGMVTDTWHMFRGGMNFHRNFDTWELIRGQERDRWRLGPKNKYDVRDNIPDEWYLGEKSDDYISTYLYNTEMFECEEDYFAAQTMRMAVRWLERTGTGREPFFLYVDTFDPHEFFDPPRGYANMYHDKFPKDRTLFGYGFDREKQTKEDLPWVRALYAGKVTFTDKWIGFLLDAVERLGMAEDTVICFVSDHGTEMLEHGEFWKEPRTLYNNVTRVPLIIRSPKHKNLAGKKIDALTSQVDIMPTLMRLIGEEPPETATGLDLWNLAEGEKEEIRDHLIIGYGRSGAVRTHDWLYQTIAQPNAKHYFGSIQQKEPALFDLKNDPEELNNVIDKHPDVRKKLQKLARKVWPEAL